MKNLSINKILLLTTAAIAVLGNNPQAIAETEDYYIANEQQVKSSTQYRCMERSGSPATVAYTSRGAIELIRWQNDYFSGSDYTPNRRCKEVSIRFQQHSDANNLRFISTGKINNYNAICISEKTGACKPDGLLITLQADDDPDDVLRNLFSLSARRANGGITRASNSKIKETIDLDRFLADSPTLKNAETPENSDGKEVIENPFDGL